MLHPNHTTRACGRLCKLSAPVWPGIKNRTHFTGCCEYIWNQHIDMQYADFYRVNPKQLWFTSYLLGAGGLGSPVTPE